jgi:hypothetical protein
MSDLQRHITIPPVAQFLDVYSKEQAITKAPDGSMVEFIDRPHDWFMHVYIFTHLQFSLDVGGYAAVKAAKDIAKAMEKAMDAGEKSYAVSADQYRRLCCCIACPSEDDMDELVSERPNQRILAKSSHGMTVPMSNFQANCYMENFDAIANASTNKPD